MKKTYLFGTMMACSLAAAVSVGAQQDQDRQSEHIALLVALALSDAPAKLNGS